jgi:hypothetical protein
VDEVAREQELRRHRRADESRQEVRDADVARREAEPDERRVHARRLAGDPHVGGERDREAAARAAPCTAAMIGCGARRISIGISAMWRCPRSRPDHAARVAPERSSLRSSPAQNARPFPRTITTRVSRSSGRRAKKSRSSSTSCSDSAFSESGRFSASQVRWPSRVISIVW